MLKHTRKYSQKDPCCSSSILFNSYFTAYDKELQRFPLSHQHKIKMFNFWDGCGFELFFFTLGTAKQKKINIILYCFFMRKHALMSAYTPKTKLWFPSFGRIWMERLHKGVTRAVTSFPSWREKAVDQVTDSRAGHCYFSLPKIFASNPTTNRRGYSEGSENLIDELHSCKGGKNPLFLSFIKLRKFPKLDAHSHSSHHFPFQFAVH